MSESIREVAIPWYTVPELDAVSCPWGNCSIEVAVDNGKIWGSFGPVSCPCGDLPGWRAERVEEMGKPGVPVKVRGRHGSRVQRASRRHRLPAWLKAYQDD